MIGVLLQDEKIPGVHLAFGDPYGSQTGADWKSTHAHRRPDARLRRLDRRRAGDRARDGTCWRGSGCTPTRTMLRPVVRSLDAISPDPRRRSGIPTSDASSTASRARRAGPSRRDDDGCRGSRGSCDRRYDSPLCSHGPVPVAIWMSQLARWPSAQGSDRFAQVVDRVVEVEVVVVVAVHEALHVVDAGQREAALDDVRDT